MKIEPYEVVCIATGQRWLPALMLDSGSAYHRAYRGDQLKKNGEPALTKTPGTMVDQPGVKFGPDMRSTVRYVEAREMAANHIRAGIRQLRERLAQEAVGPQWQQNYPTFWRGVVLWGN